MAPIAGPIEVTIGTGTPIIISRDKQFENATLTIQTPQFNLTTQASAQPSNVIKQGFGATLMLSIAETDDLALLALRFARPIIVDGTTSTKKKIEIKDDAGCQFPRNKVIIKPYDCLGPTADASRWITFPSAITATADDFSEVFGIATQRSYNFGIMAMPDPTTGVRVIIGDETATPAP